MRRTRPKLVVFLFLALVTVRPALADDGKVRIALVGDSTMADLKGRPDRPDLTGWGQVFAAFFTDRVEIVNHAQSGRSSLSFLKEGRWQKVLDSKPDWVFIQFGHNDQGGGPGRATGASTDFRDNLRRYVDEARKAGAKVTLLTPVARRTFAGGKAVSTLGPYADAVKAVGREEGVPVIDLHALSLALFDRLGDEGSAEFSPSKTDRTHWSRKGATAVAALVAQSLPNAVPELARLLKGQSTP